MFTLSLCFRVQDVTNRLGEFGIGTRGNGDNRSDAVAMRFLKDNAEARHATSYLEMARIQTSHQQSMANHQERREIRRAQEEAARAEREAHAKLQAIQEAKHAMEEANLRREIEKARQETEAANKRTAAAEEERKAQLNDIQAGVENLDAQGVEVLQVLATPHGQGHGGAFRYDGGGQLSRWENGVLSPHIEGGNGQYG